MIYGSSFWRVMVNPLLSRSAPIDAEAIPLPSDETTPPVTKMNLVLICFLVSAIILKTEFRIQDSEEKPFIF